MKRIFFTRQMRDAILAGKKTATTRDHQKPLGLWEACTGTWRNPKTVKPFAVIRITANNENTWQHSLENFTMEGFEGLEDMRRFALKTGLNRYAKAPHLYFHVFKVVR